MRFLVVVFSALICVSVSAEPRYSQSQSDARCRDVMKVAESVMYSRQNGVPMRKSLEVLDEFFNLPKDQSAYDSAQQMVIEAYEEPYYHTNKLKILIINEFSALHYRACMDFNSK